MTERRSAPWAFSQRHLDGAELQDADMWLSLSTTNSSATTATSSSSSLPQDLFTFDDAFRCLICKDLYQHPVLLIPCGHSFCSECIRKAFKPGVNGIAKNTSFRAGKQSKCPACNMAVDVSGVDYKCLTPNRALEQLVNQFRALREPLRQQLTATETSNSSSSSSLKNSMGTASTNRKESQQEADPKRGATTRQRTSPSTTLATTTAAAAAPATTAAASQPPTQPQQSYQKLPRRSYHNMKRPKLQEQCRQYGLSVTGKEPAVLIARLEEYRTLWNANCDSSVPQSAATIAHEVQKREHAKAQQAQHDFLRHDGACIEQLKAARKAMGEEDSASSNSSSQQQQQPLVASSGNAAFDAKMSQGFKDLIAHARKRDQDKKLQATTSATDSSDASSSHSDSKIESETATAVREAGRNRTDENSQPEDTASSDANDMLLGQLNEAADAVGDGDAATSTYSTVEPPPASSAAMTAPVSSEYKEANDEVQDGGWRPNRELHELYGELKQDDTPPSSTATLQTKRLLDDASMDESDESPTKRIQRDNANDNDEQRLIRADEKGRSSLVGPWSCTVCTFINDGKWHRDACQMCDTPRNNNKTRGQRSHSSSAPIELD